MANHLKPRDARDCDNCEFRSLRMFCNLSPDALHDFEAIGIQATFPKGATLFQEDQPATGVIILCSGQVKLSCASKEGKTLILKIAMPGDVLGLGAVISNAPHEVTAETLEPTMLKSIRRSDFLAFLTKHGEASLHAAKALSAEYKAAFFDARRLALSGSVAGRLAAILLDWARSAAGDNGELRFTMALTHEDLASLASTSRETVTRLLGRFQREKLIQIRGTSILIVSAEKLERLIA